MIKRIEIENFFSFGEKQTWDLNPRANVLVGINGSGKSNFLKAIHLLGEGMREGGSIQRVISSWRGFDSVCNFTANRKDIIRLSFEFDKEKLKQIIDNKGFAFSTNPVYEVEIHRVGSSDYFLKERVYSHSLQSGQTPFIHLQMDNGKGFVSERDDTGKINLKHRTYFNQPEEVFNGRELIVKEVADAKRYFPLLTLKRAIETLNVYSYFDTSPGSGIRKYQDYSIESILQNDGLNLSQVLQNINKDHTLEYEHIEAAIRRVNPTYTSIILDNQNGRLGILLKEKNLARTVPVENVSDGTLRFLLLAAIFFNPKQGNVVCIDEPETGLHPDMLRAVTEMIRHACKAGIQVILTTHNPLLLNTFELDDIWIFEKDEANQTIIKSKTEDDFDGWADTFLPGDLWLRGLIGGRRTA